MFTGKVTVCIEKDKNLAKYIKIIRGYDSSISMGHIKNAIEKGDVVFSFDSAENYYVANGSDSSTHPLEYYFIKALRELKNSGAKMIVFEEQWGRVCEDFSSPLKSGRKQKKETTDETVMEKINARWHLPQNYIEFLRSHPQSQNIEIEDEDTLNRKELTIYGANDLIDGQLGYAFGSDNQVFEEWDPNLIVIATSESDPFCIDISKETSPVLFAMHGMDCWEFGEYGSSLEEFLGN